MIISEVLPMLAGKADLEKQRLPVYTSPKLDGIRILNIEGEPFTRKLKPIPNKHAHSILSAAVLAGIDGEIIVGDPRDPDAYRKTTSSIMSHNKTPDFTLWMFDIITPNSDVPWLARWITLNNILKDLQREFPVALVPHTECETIQDILDQEAKYLLEGYEGAMLRDPMGPYKMGRSTTKEGYLTKLKRFDDSEAIIIGFEELLHNGNEAKKNALGRTERSTHKANMIGLGTLGTLLVRDIYSNVEFSIGGGLGLDAALRKEIWDNQSKYLNTIVKYRFFPGGSKDRPRFPGFHGFRDPLDL
jgi:DNA ligase-1